MLHMFRDLMRKSPLPSEWYQMRHLQNKLFTKHLRFAKALITLEFGDATDFSTNLWLESMLTVVTLIKSIQIEENIYEQSNSYMRETSATILRSLWFSLRPEHKMSLLSKILGSILEVALYNDDRLREISIPIFFDMIQVGLYFIYLKLQKTFFLEVLYQNFFES